MVIYLFSYICENFYNKLLSLKILKTFRINRVIWYLFLIIFIIENIVSDSSYQVITLQGDKISSPILINPPEDPRWSLVSPVLKVVLAGRRFLYEIIVQFFFCWQRFFYVRNFHVTSSWSSNIFQDNSRFDVTYRLYEIPYTFTIKLEFVVS